MNVQSQFFQATSLRRYHVNVAGTPGHPCLLLLHGFSGGARVWDDWAETLSSRYFLVMPDLPGHGQSFISEDRADMALHVTARDLVALLASLDVYQAGILGYSMGGRLALHFPLYAPSLVQFLILESTSAGLESWYDRQNRRDSDEILASNIVARGTEWFSEYWSHIPLFVSQLTRAPQAAARQDAIRRSNGARGLAQSLRAAGTGQQASLWSVVNCYAVPSLILAGAEDPKFLKLAHRLHQLLVHSDLQVIENAGHAAHLENPRDFQITVEKFLDSMTNIISR